MKNTFKKVIASVMAVASLTMSVEGINVSAADTNALGSTEVSISENPTRSSYSFYLIDQNEQYLASVAGPKTVHYTASVNQGGVTIIVRSKYGNFIESNYFSAGYAPSFSVFVPAGEIYKFYAYSSTASPSYLITGTVYIY